MTTTITPVLTDVCVTEEAYEVYGLRPDGSWGMNPTNKTLYSVWPIFSDVDQPVGVGIATTVRRNADRLVQALADGAAIRNVTVRTAINGQTYAAGDHVVMGRYLNADLKRIGY